MPKNYHRLIIFLFTVFICWGFIFTLLPPYAGYSDMEGKPLFVLKPEAVTLSNLFTGVLFSNAEAMVEDQFPSKEHWIETYARVQVAIGKKMIKKKALGEMGYLAAIHSDQIEDAVLDQILRLNNRLKERDIGFLYVVAPTKDYIVRDKLPSHLIYKGLDPFKRLHDGLDPHLKWLDLSEVIKEAEKKTPQYFKTDHHWNQNGYFNAYQAIVRSLNESGDMSEPPHAKDDYTWTTYSKFFLGSEGRAVTLAVAKALEDFVVYAPKFSSRLEAENLDGEKLEIVNQALVKPDVYNNDYAAYLGGTDRYAKIKNNGSDTKPKALIVGVSYAPPVVGLLGDHFSEIIYVDLRKYKEKSLYALIDAEKPDLVMVLYYTGFFTEAMYSFDAVQE